MSLSPDVYDRDGSQILPDPYEGTFGFPEWSDWRLEQRLADVMVSGQLPHRSERRADIAREAAHIVFELTWRQTNGI